MEKEETSKDEKVGGKGDVVESESGGDRSRNDTTDKCSNGNESLLSNHGCESTCDKSDSQIETTPKKSKPDSFNFKTPEKSCGRGCQDGEKLCRTPNGSVGKENSIQNGHASKVMDEKTPEKSDSVNLSLSGDQSSCETPKTGESVKLLNGHKRKRDDSKTPEKLDDSVSSNSSYQNVSSQLLSQVDDESGMISEVEQARILMAASEKYLKTLEKTPVKQNNLQNYKSPQRLQAQSPGTPGRHKRVELITIASPKAKRLKEM